MIANLKNEDLQQDVDGNMPAVRSSISPPESEANMVSNQRLVCHSSIDVFEEVRKPRKLRSNADHRKLIWPAAEQDDDDDDDDNDDDDGVHEGEPDDEDKRIVASNKRAPRATAEEDGGDDDELEMEQFVEKSLIVHRDENGFGLRVRGQLPVYVDHVHEYGAAWRAGVRQGDVLGKVNGVSVAASDHKEVVLMFKGCSRFVGLTLLSPLAARARTNRAPASQATRLPGAATWQAHLDSTCNRRQVLECSSVESAQASLSNRDNSAVSTSASATNESRRLQPLTSSSSSSSSPNRRQQRGLASSEMGDTGDGSHAPAQQRPPQRTDRFNLAPQVICSHNPQHQSPATDIKQRQTGATIKGSTGEPVGGACARRSSASEPSQPEPGVAATAAGVSALRRAPMHSSASLSSDQCTRTPTTTSLSAQKMRPQSTRSVTGASSQLDPTSRASNRTKPTISPPMHQKSPRQQIKIKISSGSAGPPAVAKFAAGPQRGLVAPTAVGHRFKLNVGGGGSSSPSLSIKSQPNPITATVTSGARQPPSSMTSQTSVDATTNSQQSQQQPKPPVNKRLEIIREFIDTEKAHTDRLRCLEELLYRPLKAGNLMTPEQLRQVFSCHRALFKIHRSIYRILLHSVNYNPPLYTALSPALFHQPLIGSALLEIFDSDLRERLERAACSFCAAQATNTELLSKLTRRDTKVGEFLAQVANQQMVGRLGLKDLLASCFQRITKYPLLLENLLRATPLPEQVNKVSWTAFGGARSPKTATRTQRRAASDEDCGFGDEEEEEEEFDDDYSGDEDDSDDEEEVDGESDEDGREQNEEEGKPNQEDADETNDKRTRNKKRRRYRNLDSLFSETEEERNARRMAAISLAEEREFIERALDQSRQTLVKVNEAVNVAVSHNKLKEIWRRTEKYPNVPLVDISKQQLIHDGQLTLRLSKRTFDVYMLLLSDYIVILTREGQDKYRLKYFATEGKGLSSTSSAVPGVAGVSVLGGAAGNATIGSSASGNSASTGGSGASTSTPTGGGPPSGASLAPATSNAIAGPSGVQQQTVFSPIFIIDEHLTTRDAATDENGFYLLCKHKNDSRIYEFSSRSPADRIKWRDKIHCAIERQISSQTGLSIPANGRQPLDGSRRPSAESNITKSSSGLSAKLEAEEQEIARLASVRAQLQVSAARHAELQCRASARRSPGGGSTTAATAKTLLSPEKRKPITVAGSPTKIEGTITYVEDDEIVLPSKMESTQALVERAVPMSVLNNSIHQN